MPFTEYIINQQDGQIIAWVETESNRGDKHDWDLPDGYILRRLKRKPPSIHGVSEIQLFQWDLARNVPVPIPGAQTMQEQRNMQVLQETENYATFKRLMVLELTYETRITALEARLRTLEEQI